VPVAQLNAMQFTLEKVVAKHLKIETFYRNISEVSCKINQLTGDKNQFLKEG